jgi:two-component system, LytTR family, response regulator
MINCIVIDDSEDAIKLMKRHIGAKPNLVLLETFIDPTAALNYIENNSVDLVFVDIQMPMISGLELIETLQARKGKALPHFILTTGHSEYALESYNYEIMDYILKPVTFKRFSMALDRYLNKTSNTNALQIVNSHAKTEVHDSNHLLQNHEVFLSNLKLKSGHAKISVPTFEGLQMINTDEIVKCTAEENYTHIFLLSDTRIMVSRLLKEYEELLADYNFFRIHNSCLINLAHVTKYIKGEGGYVVMRDGSSVEVSRRKKNELLLRLSIVQT